MKLYEIWNAVNAWKTIQALKKKPSMAYQFLMYGKEIGAQLLVCEERRQQIIYEVSGAEPGTPVDLTGTPEFTKYEAEFQEFMRAESTLKPLDMTLADLITALDAEAGNRISEDDLELLEPFFKQ